MNSLKSFSCLMAAFVFCLSAETACSQSACGSFGAYEHVIVLGVDGAGAFFSSTVTPNTFRIFADGASSDSVLTSRPTISAQCWGSLLLGVLPQTHGLTNDIISARPYDTESACPSVFRVIRQAMPDAPLASFCNWNPINFGIVEDNLGVVKGTGDDPSVAAQVVDYLANNDPTLLFVQFDSVDAAGHANGYGTAGHLTQLAAVDTLIGDIYDAVSRKDMFEKTLFIVTADHGGTPEGTHGGDTDAERYVYLGIRGETVIQGGRIEDAEFRDIPSIAVYALGLNAPDVWTGSVPSGIFKSCLD